MYRTWILLDYLLFFYVMCIQALLELYELVTLKIIVSSIYGVDKDGTAQSQTSWKLNRYSAAIVWMRLMTRTQCDFNT